MSNIIFYFSGTGNSLSAARSLADKLGDTEVVSIADAIKQEHISLPYERVGFVFPVYFGGNLPPIIERFAGMIDFGKAGYVFAVTTATAMHGGSLDALAGIMAKIGGHLDAGFHVNMPGNYIAMYGAFPAPMQRFWLRGAKKKISEIAKCVKEKRVNRTGKENTAVSKSLRERMSGYEKFAKDYRVTDKCTSCETCAKICPMRNVTMAGGKPQFGENCERCMACIQWCPVKAIEYKDITEKRKRYRNPDIKASDLFPKQ